jgi:hypothetical protein
MDPRQRVKNYIDRHGIANPERIRRALYNGKGGPVPTSVIREVLAEVSGQPLPTPPSPKSVSPSPGSSLPVSKVKTRTLAEFRSQHDYALKLKRAIAELGAGYVTEHEMKAASGIPNHVWRRYADLPEFQQNKLKLRDVTYWARPGVIEEMKEIVGPI